MKASAIIINGVLAVTAKTREGWLTIAIDDRGESNIAPIIFHELTRSDDDARIMHDEAVAYVREFSRGGYHE